MMEPWIVWVATFLAGALGAGVGTMLATRGPKARMKRLETTQRSTVDALIAMTDAILRLELNTGDISPETTERIREQIKKESKK